MKQTISILITGFVCSNAIAQSVTLLDPIDQRHEHHTHQLAPVAWTHFGGSAKHHGQSNLRLSNASTTLDSPTWIAGTDDTGTSYIPLPQTGLVGDAHRIYAIATDPKTPGSSFAVAFDRFTGGFQWATPIPARVLESWSTPTLDLEHQQLLIAIADELIAIDTNTGSNNWSTNMSGILVNASPIVTDDLGNRDRAFITNYSLGGGSPARLTCINVDPFDAIDNPYQPGEIVWQTALLGDSSGNTPGYAHKTVYVATAAGTGSQRGQIHAFDANATSAPSPSWTFTNTINAGFYSGLSIARGHLYASSYSFNGLQFNSNTVKLDRATGDLVWSVPTNRTDASPVILPSGDVIVSGGVSTTPFDFIPFFGTLPSIEFIQDSGDSASVLWDSAIETLDDANDNGTWDIGESFLSLGGWTHQPISVTVDRSPMLLVGTLDEATLSSYIGHCTDLQLVDLTKHPTDPGFVAQRFTGAGSTPAVIGSWIYTSGESGIVAFDTSPSVKLRSPDRSPQDIVRAFLEGRITRTQLIEQLQP
tara:strand:+ start:56663 stop:58261 length:1599 start_codon:yes stop_codon:yes gene_type:complete